MNNVRNFIVAVSENYYNKIKLAVNENAENTLSDFVHNPQTLLVQSIVHSDHTLLLTSEIQSHTKSIIFYKTQAKELLSEDAVKDINFMSFSHNAIDTLYQMLRQIYSPLLAKGNDLYSNTLHKNITDLESNLKVLTHGRSNGSVDVILSIEDEAEYWKLLGIKKDSSKKEIEASTTFSELFHDITEEIRTMQSSSMSDIRESAENIGGLLDEVWRFTTKPYPQERMTHIFNIIGHNVCSVIQKQISSTDLWKVHNSLKDSELLKLLSDSLDVIQTWIGACRSLSETYWPNYALHIWNGNPYVPQFCINFESRVKEIHEIRSVHNQLEKLLSFNERSEYKTDELFLHFKDINVWIYNAPHKDWESAMSRYTANLRAAETKVAEKLKSRLHNVSTKQTLYEFLRYKTLIRRPVVKQSLYNELEIFVSSLMSMLKEIQEQLDADEIDVKMYQPPEMAPVVQQIQWMKQMEAKVKDVKIIAEEYLKEFSGSVDLSNMSTKLLTDLKVVYTQLYDDWCKDLQTEVSSGSLQLQLEQPVVEFTAARLLRVRFSRRAAWTEAAARALAALQLPAPPAAAHLDLLARKLHHAHQLHQIASFHNTIGERMVPSTRPMMLQAALDLSAAVQDQKAVYWDDEQQLVNYIDKLKKVVLKLETQNTYLTAEHVAIRNLVEKLADTEILDKHGEWKKCINEIRNMIEKVESNGYKNTELWRTHWDGQLYKTLECQYIKTLLSLHNNFPSYRVDLVLRGHKVRVQPPLEEVRVHHYNQLRRLVSLPATFVGLQASVTDVKSIFASIVNKHSWLGNKAVTQLEAAFSSLERVCLSWTKKAALACVPDLEALCSETLKEPTDWEVNFKACKAYGQAVAKMSFEDEKIDWITVGTATLRREFEAQTRNLWACLMSSLQTSCRSDVTNLEAFIANATIMMENKALPKNAKELAEVSAKQQALANKMPEMEKLVEMLKRKSHLLRTWGGDPSIDDTLREWKQTREMMLSHQKIFEHQAEIVKSSLNGEFENLNTSLEAWLSRWNQNKMKYESTHGVQYSEMVDRCRQVFEAKQQWDKFVADRDELLKECTKFNLAPAVGESWPEAEKLITDFVNLWSVLQHYHEELESLSEQDWLVFHKKLHLLDEFTTKWSARLEPFTFITLFIQQELDKYADLHIQLKYLRGADFTERHWHEVYNLLEMEYKRPEALKLRDFLNVSANIKKHILALQKINANSQSESAIRAALSELEIWFAGARFTITYYNDKNKRPTPIVKDYKEILNKVEEQQWVLSSISAGSDGGGGDACAAWELRVRRARTAARTAHRAQRRWLYLEPILSNDDGELGLKFRKVDQVFRQVMRMVESDPRLSALLQSTRLQPMLDSISDQLLACQSALNQYIEGKRSIFPRLYFLSDDDLLELLGQARAGAEGREVVMQTHLKKLFPGITGVRLGPGGLSVTALCSQFDETFQLDHPVDIDCPVEIWLKSLESEMRSSLKNMIHKCMLTNSLYERDPFSLPTQILCLAQNIRFTEQVEKAITSKDLHKLKSNLEKENSYYAETHIVEDKERIKRQALILQCTNYLFVVQTLIDNNVVLTSDWLWQKQLRFYLVNSKEVVAKMGLAQISYSYEYLGVNTGQFVRTELADECFFILTQALHLNLVGNPFGPAGTGKTESVKALGGLMGRLVLIFNCDEAMDAQCMGRLLSGVAACGAWGCFDEFNRLSAHTLAAVAHQLADLLAAPANNNIATINGKQLAVSAWSGVAATLNPAGRGYGGRRRLPAALQAVLRPVAMMQPAPRQLAAHLLAAACVASADDLAGDLHNVFDFASSLLSDQRHYDWGLRALKAAVGSCAAALANNTNNNPRAVLRTVLRLNNYSKLTRRDAERFENILTLVFGDVAEEKSDSDPMRLSLATSLEALGLVENKQQIQKCVELYEQLQQRMGVVVVGPPGSGKSTIRQLLKTALTTQGRTIEEYMICPKAMCRGWLLGNIDPDTRLWSDGAISATALDVTNQPDNVWSWVVCDGDIDPEWIEALNSVLDDNRLLTLPSGWRIQFGPNVNFIFETHSLEHASPATISRMGIILLSEDTSCALEVTDSWLEKADFDNETVNLAIPLLHKVIKKCVEWLKTHKSDVLLKICDVAVVKQILTQFESFASNITLTPMYTSPEEIVYTAVNRSLIDVIKPNAVDHFHDELSEILGPVPSPAHIPTEWITDNLLISTRLSASVEVLRASAAADQHMIIVGPDASAKNLLAEYVLKDLNLTVITIDCTPMLEPEHIIAELKRNNALRSGGGGGGSSNKRSRVVLLVRAIHRARVDSWGSSAVHSLLLQLMQCGHVWVSGGELAARARCDVTVLATAAAAPAAPARLLAVPHTYITEPDEEELSEIVKHHLRQNVNKNIEEKHFNDFVIKMLALYKEVSETFTSRPHYKWNASHLRKWCENIKLYSTNTIDELCTAIFAEAKSMFRDRLVTEQEKSEYSSISRKYLKLNSEELYFNSKLRSNGVILETVDKKEWYYTTQKLINQCLTEHDYNVFGETGAEACSELAVLCPAMAKVCQGGLVVCISASGVGRKAAAAIAAASINANIAGLDANAILSASEGTRTLIVLNESSCNDSTLGCVEALIKASSLHAIPAKLLPSTQPTQNMFENIKQNLGIVICLDRDEPNLAKLIAKYPFIYNDGHCIWIERLSDETLRELPKLVVQRLNKQSASDNLKEELDVLPTEGFVNIYNSLDTEWRKTPCRYVNFIKAYYHIVNKKKTMLLQRKEILSRGVEALLRAREEVSNLQQQASSQEAALGDKQQRANLALDQISATVRDNNSHKEDMQRLKDNMHVENQKLQVRKKEIEAELATVEPVIAAARAAVAEIKPEALSEVRSLRAPPDVVRDVLEGVLRLMGIADTSWHSMKNFLSKRGVKEDIRCLDASQISPEAVASVEKLLERRAASFRPEVSKRASAAVAPLAAWVTANLAHAHAQARVAPLRAQQDRLTRNLKEAEAQLTALSSGLLTVDERVAALKEQLGQYTREAAAIELKLTNAKETINAANNLLQQLQRENVAWENDLKYISKEITELSVRSLLAAAYIVFLPDCTEPEAGNYQKQWAAMIGFQDETFSVINFLSSAEKQLKWDADGLPLDKSAIKNAVSIDQFLEQQKLGFTPLIIDPDGNAISWLKTTMTGVQCEFVSQNSESLHTAVQYAIRLGRILVITDVDNIPDNWSSIILGNNSARLLLYTRDATIEARLQPQLIARLSLLQFTARLDGLTDQLVQYALQQQNPEVNEKSKELKLKKAELQKQQHELQENLLKDLSSNSDILHDANLLASLNKTQSTSVIITEALEAASSIELETRSACETYEKTAYRAALLALAVKGLVKKKPLVTLPVDTALSLYVDAIRKTEIGKTVNNEEVVKYFTRRVLERVLLAVHTRDKYTVVLHLLKEVYDDLIPDNLWQVFIGRHDQVDEQNVQSELGNYPDLHKDCILKLAYLKQTNEDFYNRLSLKNQDLWKKFQRTGDFNILSSLKLSQFETVVAAACMKPDSLYRAVVALVDSVIGGAVLVSRDVLAAAARVCVPRPAPPALLLAAHAPLHHAHKVGIEEGVSAWETALESTRSGGWLAIIVGASPFTKELHNFIQLYLQRPAEDFSEDFRLWIVCEEREIPPLLSNVCVTVILEPPEGVKANALSTLSSWGNVTEPADVVRMRAHLALFHAIVQQRRQYIPQGWSRWYEWEQAEAAAAARAAAAAPRGGARPLLAALYAARATEPADRRVLAHLLHAVFDDTANMPHAAQLQAYFPWLESLPSMDSPELLSLPANCRRAWEKKAIEDIISGLKELGSTINTHKKDSGSAPLKSLLAMWKKYMSGSPLLKADFNPDKGSVSWWECVCGGEALEVARAARRIHDSLAASRLRMAALHTVPEEWQRAWPGPESPQRYLREFCARARAALARIDHITDHYFPTEVCARDVCRLERVVSSVRARSSHAAHAALAAAWDPPAGNPNGVIITGLMLSGGEWDKSTKTIRMSGVDSAPTAPAPPILLQFVKQSPLVSESSIEIPLYNNESRDRALLYVLAPLTHTFTRRLAHLHALALFVAPLE